jgi:hypothetical protein
MSDQNDFHRLNVVVVRLWRLKRYLDVKIS